MLIELKHQGSTVEKSSARAVSSAKAGVLDVSNFTGFTVETWIAFLSDDGINASNSIYTGELTV